MKLKHKSVKIKYKIYILKYNYFSPDSKRRIENTESYSKTLKSR